MKMLLTRIVLAITVSASLCRIVLGPWTLICVAKCAVAM